MGRARSRVGPRLSGLCRVAAVLCETAATALPGALCDRRRLRLPDHPAVGAPPERGGTANRGVHSCRPVIWQGGRWRSQPPARLHADTERPKHGTGQRGPWPGARLSSVSARSGEALHHRPLPDRPGQSLFLGHSYGALLGTQILFTEPGMFNGYVLGSPSLWYDKRHA